MPLQIYPYNTYILYFAIILVVVFFILLIVKLITLSKTMKQLEPQLQSIQKQSQWIEIKTSAISEKKEEDRKKNKYLKLLLPIVLAIHSIYKKDEDLHGVGGYAKATKRYVHQQNEEKKLFKRFEKYL